MFRLIVVRYFLIIFLLLNFWAMPSAFAASGAETRAFKSAGQLLDAKLFSLAEMNFARFIQEYPESSSRNKAVLHQAESRFFQTNYTGALELLQAGLPRAGALAHEYQNLMAQTFFQSGNFRAAADAYAALNKNFPESAHSLEACYGEALAESKLGNWPRVVELLQTPGGKFNSAAKTQPNSSFVTDGHLLLAEAFLKQSRFDEGEKILAQLEGRATIPETKWRQNYLRCRIQLAASRPADALATTTNLVTAAQESGSDRLFAESILLRGEILENLNRLAEASEVYAQNFAEGTPADIRRQSFFKTVDLDLAQGRATNAIQRLQNFVEQNPADASVDLARLTLGELRLKQYAAQTNSSALAGNMLEQAFTNFSAIITNFPQSAHLGKAYLDRGWCFWLQEQFPEAESDFFQATQRLPVSEDKAVAGFKLADAQFRQTNYAAAMTNYQLLIQNYAALERVTNSLFEPALYQSLRASLEIGNTAAATNAMHKLLDWFPNGSLGDRSLLLVGENLTRANKEGEARELFLKHVSDSPRAAEIKLAIAQTFVQEKKWPAALAEFDAWVTNFAAHPLLPEGEFSRALAHDKAGKETNAFILFTNFVARFPSNSLAALAQNWIADFYWNHGDYRNAEKSYQELYQKFNPTPELGYQARLMAGRAAYDRSDYSEAAKYFSALITLLDKDTNAAASLTAEAWFALGDTTFQDFLSNTNEAAVRDAITAFTRVTKDFATNPLAARAWGRMGDCYFQWAGQDPAQAVTRYQRAIECYGVVREAPLADIAARSQSEVAVGNVCVKRAEGEIAAYKKDWLDAALQHYTNVVFENNLRDGETFDAKWVYEAGVAAAKICEGSEQWEQAMKIYEQLATLLPPLRPVVEKKIALAQKHLDTGKN